MRRLLSILLLAACASALLDEPPVAGIRPEAFFDGLACGRGVMTRPGGTVEDRVLVVSRGELAGGGLVLDQSVRTDDGEAKTRRWVMWPDGPNSYRGTLTGPGSLGASGGVRVWVAGEQMLIRYPVQSIPLGRMEQVLTLLGDGSVMNTATVSVLGVPLRRLSERIEPVPDGLATKVEQPCYEAEEEEG